MATRVAVVLIAVAVMAVQPAGPTGAARPSASPRAVRPGPDVLYAPEPRAPQLENRDPRFRQPFDRVSGTDRYADGEYLYTDHLYDDTGAGGDLTYPADRERYADNAADLVELRVVPGRRDVAYRFTLNTLLASDTTIAAVAFDTDRSPATGSATLPRDPGAPFPGTDAVLTTWGAGSEWSVWTGAGWRSTPLATAVDLEANQITTRVPRTVVDPRSTWRATLAVGLHDVATGGWLRPDPDQPGIFNLGFRFDEPVLHESAPPDEAQSAALAAGEPTRFAHDIDFPALDARVRRTTVPSTGTMVRFFPSRLDRGEGKDLDEFPALLGQLQPYSLYVPSSVTPPQPVGFTLDLHSLGENHWQYNGSVGVQQLGEQRANLVATPHARGEDGWYQHEAEYDVFEVWNDVASHYTLDPDSVAITGYSMGGYGTYRLATLYPDLFGKAMTVVGPPGDGIWVPPVRPTGGMETLSNLWLENARHVPFLNVAAVLDELVPIAGTTAQSLAPPGTPGAQSFDALGYRFRFQAFPTAEHLTIAILSYDLPQAVEFFGESRVERDPAHVTFSHMPAADDPELGLVHDHAYWISGLGLADPEAGSPLPEATVDVRSLAAGAGDPPSLRGQGAGTAPLPYTEVNRDWGDAPATAASNTFVATLTNVGSVTLDVAAAGLDVDEPITLDVDATHDGTIHLVHDDGVVVEVPVAAGAGTYVVSF